MINTVKIQKNGYLVNGNMSVPNVPGNKDYQDVLEWIAEGNTPEAERTTEELTAMETQAAYDKEIALLEELDIESIRDMREWLASQAEAPQTLKERELKAVAARARIAALKALKTLKKEG